MFPRLTVDRFYAPPPAPPICPIVPPRKNHRLAQKIKVMLEKSPRHAKTYIATLEESHRYA